MLIRACCFCRSNDGASENLESAAYMVFFVCRLRPRILVDVSSVDTITTVLGFRISMPIMVSPTAHHKLAHPEGGLNFFSCMNPWVVLVIASQMISVW